MICACSLCDKRYLSCIPLVAIVSFTWFRKFSWWCTCLSRLMHINVSLWWNILLFKSNFSLHTSLRSGEVCLTEGIYHLHNSELLERVPSCRLLWLKRQCMLRNHLWSGPKQWRNGGPQMSICIAGRDLLTYITNAQLVSRSTCSTVLCRSVRSSR